MGEVFRGTEALANGQLTAWTLRRWYRPIFRDVYVPKRQTVTIDDLIYGAWLWSKRSAVITGVAASALHGAEWVNADIAVELRMDFPRPPRGIIARNQTLLDDEVTRVRGRFQRRGQAVTRLDALMRAKPFSIEDILLVDKHHPGARGVRRLRKLLPLIDGGAASPKESWLRLLLVDAGLPKPTTQIPVYDDWGLIGLLDMGWEAFKVAAEYDGDQHRTDRLQYVKDLRRIPKFEHEGWIVIRVVAEDNRIDIIDRVRHALLSRGWKP
jgi:hypothetical protein